ncbi:Leucine-rich repeat serine/threonine-protein kinase 1-like protein [Dinothrombium tinctorium]|uniref:non-specific serine/threonine protein kinase n=1 Tax=Dinothrombium tinctorium TaxID=1965070 RepID=A0A3S3SPH3_9ACAR|nr:Leucine-rich repeat serine/threonine-protein kinase 1-like protein [Dinothrombium tinctorium]
MDGKQSTSDAKVDFSPKAHCLDAITKLDFCNTRLTEFPFRVLQINTLRILNLSQNLIDSIPNHFFESGDHSIAQESIERNITCQWRQSLLEELYLQDNRLETVPCCLFELPSLQLLDLSNNKLRTLPYEMWTATKLKELNLSLNLLRELPIKPGEDPLVPLSVLKRNLSNLDSLEERQESESETESESIPESDSSKINVNLKKNQIKHLNFWSSNVEVVSVSLLDEQYEMDHQCNLTSLNLSHNGFTSIPPNLACLAVNLSRLNFSYNCLSRMGSVKLYPANLKHLDLSHNQISSWMQVQLMNESNSYCMNCFNPRVNSDNGVKLSRFLGTYCIHKQHNRLDNLRTLIVSHNQLSSLDVVDSEFDFNEFEQLENEVKLYRPLNKICFPSLSMLDVSYNQIREIPSNLSELSNLSVLNISGNVEINRLPPEMGLLSKLWNLRTNGCNLSEPLKSMIESKKHKTMDIIGYLKSILEDSKPYARMKLMLVGVQGIGKTSLLEQLRQEGTGSYKKKPPEHWAKRMGNKNVNLKTPKGVTLSTVGVDVCDWTYEKKRGKNSFGPVTFRTWDFGGQKEYYATHQYFLSKRSLYLVVWKMIDGEKGVENIHQWLVNIQARAPNAPVIIVGTHYDLMGEFFPRFYTDDLQQMIREKFIYVVDPDKIGLPHVIDTIEVSIKTRHNIKKLCNLIYDTAFEIRCPGSKERLLEQKVPATYIALEDVISHLVYERHLQGKDPVLRAEKYKSKVMEEMKNRYNKSFRDIAELHQATAFLHENGVLLHYDDATLKDLYFLDPQWLFDLLAHVITIREINPYAKKGIMKTDDLRQVFKSSCVSPEAKEYIVNLLNKFEVALTWDSRTLLIPSLLPKEEHLQGGEGCDVRIPVRSRGWAMRNAYLTAQSSALNEDILSPCHLTHKSITLSHENLVINAVSRPNMSIYRLFLMTYFPSGFWSRLMTRVLAEDLINDIVKSYFIIPKQAHSDIGVISLLSQKAEWKCWQTGMSLLHLDTEIFRVKEALPSVPNSPFDYTQQIKFLVQQEGNWTDVEIEKTSILEIYLPNQMLNVESQDENATLHRYVIEPNQECVAKLLSLIVEHIDTLLEDWYPSLGTRFIHTSEGKFLVTRLVPCLSCMNQCLPSFFANSEDFFDSYRSLGSDERHELSSCSENSETTVVNVCDRNIKSPSSCDSGISDESSNPKNSALKLENFAPKEGNVVYSFLVEDCVCKAAESKTVCCQVHDELDLRKVAPDTVFADLGDQYLIKSENIKRGKMLGRGAFGFVFQAKVKTKDSDKTIDVAMKMLQPIDPGHEARISDTVAYKAAWNKWERDPMQYSCKAYCIARQELNILLTLRHPHIVPLTGVCTNPLALILPLAKLGSLDIIIKDYRKANLRFHPVVLQKVLLQVAKALEYLHQQHIIYRDLKSENVLVWEIPTPNNAVKIKSFNEVKVDVKLADYGISRPCLPTGMKGFGGTEGFMAPEIMRYNGEEEYTEKVDCFSFAMFMYELISLRLPFEGVENVKDHILEGGRPTLTQRNTLYPSHVLDLMALCWSQLPKDRPNASQIVSITSAPEFIHMLDAITLVDNHAVLSAVVLNRNSLKLFEFWISRLGKQVDLLTCNDNCIVEYKTVVALNHVTITSLCVIPESGIWLGDSKAVIYIFCDTEYKQLSSFRLDPNDDTPTAVQTIRYVSTSEIIAISSSNGRLWLCTKDSLQLREIPNNGMPFLCLAVIGYECDWFELWCGQAEGNICIYTIKNTIVASQEIVCIYEESKSTPLMQRLDVFNLVNDSNHVWTYLCTGCIVYQWSIENRSCLRKLDCSKLVPCSESLLTISIEDHLLLGKCQITSIAVMDKELFIGTTGGCLIVVEASTMRPVTVFRPYEEEIQIIVPFKAKNQFEFNVNKVENEEMNQKKFILTVGKGFRSLIARYVNMPDEGLSLTTQKGSFAILWSTENWNI